MYLEHAPACAQGIVNQWGQMSEAKIQWTPEFDAVLNLACRYLDAIKQREQCEHLETIGNLKGKLDDAIAEAKEDEASKRLAFVEAYKAAEEKTAPGASCMKKISEGALTKAQIEDRVRHIGRDPDTADGLGAPHKG